MGNIWGESSCTEEGCKLSKRQKCPAAVKWGMLAGINRTRAYKAYEGRLLLWPQGGNASAGAPCHISSIPTPTSQLELQGKGAELLEVLSKNWWCHTSGKGWKSLHISRLLLEGGNNPLLAALGQEAVALHSESFRLILVKYIPVGVLRYWARPWVKILKNRKNKSCCE